MRRDHRPFLIKYWLQKWQRWYVERFVRPHFDCLGIAPMIVAPQSVEIHGANISAGNYLHIVSSVQKPVRLTTWSSKQHAGAITIGDYCLFAPGVEITAAGSIVIGDNCMLAANVAISDCDWHGLYNRLRPFRCTAPVILHDNVWLGHNTIICKGVTIGANSVIGAGSVVTRDIPPNVVAAGNPAKVVKLLNPKRRFLKREFLFQRGNEYWQQQDKIDEYFTANNSWRDWLRSVWSPNNKD